MSSWDCSAFRSLELGKCHWPLQAASSGSIIKAPGFAGGYLLIPKHKIRLWSTLFAEAAPPLRLANDCEIVKLEPLAVVRFGSMVPKQCCLGLVRFSTDHSQR